MEKEEYEQAGELDQQLTRLKQARDALGQRKGRVADSLSSLQEARRDVFVQALRRLEELLSLMSSLSR